MLMRTAGSWRLRWGLRLPSLPAVGAREQSTREHDETWSRNFARKGTGAGGRLGDGMNDSLISYPACGAGLLFWSFSLEDQE
jgi:hypothetical protein